MIKVRGEELRVGMYVHRIEGSWLAHGLWRRRFLIADAATLAATRACGAQLFMIDDSLGVAPSDMLAQPIRPQIQFHSSPLFSDPSQDPAPRLEVGSNGGASLAKPCSMAEELARAAQVRTRACDTVATMFSAIANGRSPDVETARAVVAEVVASVDRNAAALTSLMRLKSLHDYTYMHSVSVCVLMVALARQVGVDDDRCSRLGLAGLVHDVGKAAIPASILDKPGKLSDEEFALVRTHSQRGRDILVECGLDDEVALSACLHHHEKIDGTGYPSRLAAEDIPHAARMAAICDVYDAVTSNRAYKQAWDPAIALERMASWTGHFDRALLAAFIKMIGVYPVGALVRLASGRLAVVVENHQRDLQKPVVKVFYSVESQRRVPVERLDLSTRGVSDRIEAREPRDGWPDRLLDGLCGLTDSTHVGVDR